MMANEGIAEDLLTLKESPNDSNEIANPQEESFELGDSRDDSDLQRQEIEENLQDFCQEPGTASNKQQYNNMSNSTSPGRVPLTRKKDTKIRKKSHISSQGNDGKQKNGRWSMMEHVRFLEALKNYGKNWKKVEEHVATRTSTQARSHAQKFFANILKRNMNMEQFLENLTYDTLQELRISAQRNIDGGMENQVDGEAEIDKLLMMHMSKQQQNEDLSISENPRPSRRMSEISEIVSSLTLHNHLSEKQLCRIDSQRQSERKDSNKKKRINKTSTRVMNLAMDYTSIKNADQGYSSSSKNVLALTDNSDSLTSSTNMVGEFHRSVQQNLNSNYYSSMNNTLFETDMQSVAQISGLKTHSTFNLSSSSNNLIGGFDPLNEVMISYHPQQTFDFNSHSLTNQQQYYQQFHSTAAQEGLLEGLHCDDMEMLPRLVETEIAPLPFAHLSAFQQRPYSRTMMNDSFCRRSGLFGGSDNLGIIPNYLNEVRSRTGSTFDIKDSLCKDSNIDETQQFGNTYGRMAPTVQSLFTPLS